MAVPIAPFLFVIYFLDMEAEVLICSLSLNSLCYAFFFTIYKTLNLFYLSFLFNVFLLFARLPCPILLPNLQ